MRSPYVTHHARKLGLIEEAYGDVPNVIKFRNPEYVEPAPAPAPAFRLGGVMIALAIVLALWIAIGRMP